MANDGMAEARGWVSVEHARCNAIFGVEILGPGMGPRRLAERKPSRAPRQHRRETAIGPWSTSDLMRVRPLHHWLLACMERDEHVHMVVKQLVDETNVQLNWYHGTCGPEVLQHLP